MWHVTILSFNEWVEKRESSQPVLMKKKKMRDGTVAATNRYQNRLQPDYQNFVPAKPIWKC